MAKETKNNAYNFSNADINLIKVLLSLPEDHLQYTKLFETIYGQPMSGNMAQPIEAMKSVRRIIADKEFYDTVDNFLAGEADPSHCSSESYEITKATNMNHLEQIVYACILSSENPISRSEICDRTGLAINSTTARVRSLVQKGKIRVEGTKLDKDTNRKVSLLVVRTK